jgi:signal transduction histidine kinase/ligand-binding sensor domain-containing protein
MKATRVWLTLAIACTQPATAWAVDPSRRISQYAHYAWRIQDGLFTGGFSGEIVQTKDGYLWIGTESGLLRFDGVRFVPWRPEQGEQLPSPRVLRLLAGRDGSLWIGTTAGLSRLQDQRLTTYPGPGGVISIREDRNGTIWFGLSAPAPGSGPLCRVVGENTHCFTNAEGVPSFRGVGSLVEDAHGSIWVGGNTHLLRWTNGAVTQYSPSGLQNNAGFGGILALAAAPERTLWVGMAKKGPGLGLQRLVNGQWQPFETPQLAGSELFVTALHRDRDGARWIGTGDRGLYRILDDTVDHYDSTKGLSSDYVIGLSEDREGTLWVTTGQGIDRFSDTAVVAFSMTEGLCSQEAVSLLATRDGTVWIGGDGALGRLREGTLSCLRAAGGLPGSQVTSLFEDRGGRVWIGLDNNLFMYDGGAFRQVRKPDGTAIGLVTGITEDANRHVWIAVSASPRVLMRIDGLTVRDEYRDVEPRRVVSDPTGGLWVGLVSGDLAHFQDGAFDTYPLAPKNATPVNQLLSQADGSVLAATSYGLVAGPKGRLSVLSSKNGLPCDVVHGITFDRDGDLWLMMDCGLGELPRAELAKWRQAPESTVALRTLDVLDGVRTGRAPFDGAASAPDGRLWFTNGLQVQTIDPARVRRNAIAPPVHVEQVVADRTAYTAADIVRLPPLTRDLRIDYVGLSFVAPLKVLFRYRLEGRDDAWQEAGTRRQAFYNDLRPGTYRFRVIASNNDGVWNDEGASLEIVVAPAWYQTGWFLAVSVVTGGAVAWAAYRLRLRQVAATLNARFDERLAERTRVARDLHDTLLQTVQGSKMVADNALDRPDDAAGMRRAMEQVSSWLGQAGQEGRAAVNALRISTTERNDLVAAFRRAIDDCSQQGSIVGSLTVAGDAREMHPIVRDEVYRIGYEAIRNACTHSGGRRLEVRLEYGRDLIVGVADDGTGIDAALASEGKAGHFGLSGMRERAARIGATLSVVGAPGAGTEVVVTVPGRVIFRRSATTLLETLAAVARRRPRWK